MDKSKICVSAIYRNTNDSIEKFIGHHDRLSIDIIFVVDTTGTMDQKMITNKFSSDKVMFTTLDDAEINMSDKDIVNSIILPHCKKHKITWMLHLNIKDRIDFNGFFGDIHSFLDSRPECEGIVVIKVTSEDEGEARCITKVNSTISMESKYGWKYYTKNVTIIRGSTNEVYRYGEYKNIQKILKDKCGKSRELLQILDCSLVDKIGWMKYLKSFIY